MEFRLLVLAVVLITSSTTLAEESDVLELDASNFDDQIADLDIALVEFYAPWLVAVCIYLMYYYDSLSLFRCGHCKRLAPEYETAATALMAADPPVPLVKVDCPANSDLCGKFGVTGYPTLKIFRGGEVSADYSGPRSAGEHII